MSPVTTRRRSPQRVEARRRQGAGRVTTPLPTLFDAVRGGAPDGVEAAPGGATARVETASEGATVGVGAGQRVAEPPSATGHGETLDRLVVSSWERLISHSDAPCLLCGGTMEPRYGAHAASIGGRCGDCGTTLS